MNSGRHGDSLPQDKWPDNKYLYSHTEFREYKEPETPGKRTLRDNKGFQRFTFGVMLFAIAWIIATPLGFHASKITFVGFLAALIFYAGEYICWKRPKLPPLPPRHERKKRGLVWTDVPQPEDDE